MKISKILKGIMGIGAVSGVAYAVYKLGEANGKANERIRQKYDDVDMFDCDDDKDFDEPDDSCIASNINKWEITKDEKAQP